MHEEIGAKREQIVIQSNTPTTDSSGDGIDSWPTYATVRARASFLSGRELEGMSKINSMSAVRFVINYRTDITEQMRVLWRSKQWNIHAILPSEDKFDMALITSKVE